MKIYIVGIGGAGTSALATIYHENGHEVLGSDVGDGFYTKNLQGAGVVVHSDISADHISKDIDLVIHSTAIEISKHSELVKAAELGIRTITYPEAIGQITRDLRSIAVCGTHGKTTTTALVGHAFLEMPKIKPTVLVGSHVVGWGSGAYVQGDHCFIFEADEYQNKLSLYEPCCVILTSVDFDHPDFFGNLKEYKKVFLDFIERIPSYGCIVACGDDKNVRSITEKSQQRIIYYGTGPDNDFQITARDIREDGQMIHFRCRSEEFEIFTQLPGEHNAKNALAAWIVANRATNQRQDIYEGIKRCAGTARRFERRGELNGAMLVDDYAHHPKEIVATISAAREVYSERKLTVAFHPHTFTRTEALLEEFADALDAADQVIVLDIYGSAREKKGKVTAQTLVDAVNERTKDRAIHIDKITALAEWMEKGLGENDVFFTLGAGDIWKVYDEVM